MYTIAYWHAYRPHSNFNQSQVRPQQFQCGEICPRIGVINHEKNTALMVIQQFFWEYPLVNVYSLLLKMAIEIVDLPII